MLPASSPVIGYDRGHGAQESFRTNTTLRLAAVTGLSKYYTQSLDTISQEMVDDYPTSNARGRRLLQFFYVFNL